MDHSLAWGERIVSLHSFSKDFAIPGYRVGALVASPRLIREAMKVLDCVQICAPRIGRSEVERTYTALFSINDLSVRLDHVLADGNHVAVRFRVLGSIGGQRFEVPIADFFEVRDGLIVYDLGVFDNAGRPCRP